MINMVLNNGRVIGKGHPTYIIAEMSANHAGSFQNAIEIIRAAKAAGADCVKLQAYTADTLTINCSNPHFQIKEGTWKGENLYQLYEKAYTPWEWFSDLKKYAMEIGIDFLVTPFDKTSVDFLESLDVTFYKIASFELIDTPLIQYIASKGKPIIMSTGMASIGEIDAAVTAILNTKQVPLALLKCTSAYPAIYEEMNLATIPHMRDLFNIPIGLSDHSMGSVANITAVALGANIIEKHFCISRQIENPDASFSMEPDEFSEMVDQIRKAESALGQIYYGISPKESQNKKFRRSLFVVENIPKGQLITIENVRSIRPAGGLEPMYLPEIIGKKARIDIEKGTPLSWKLME